VIVDYQNIKIVDMITDKVVLRGIHHILMFFLTFCVFVFIEKWGYNLIDW
jgi:hypothetical protein